MKKILLLTISISSLAIASEGSIGAGIQIISPLQQTDSEKILPLPIINIEYSNFYISGTNLGFNLYKEKNFNLSAFLNPLDGYFSGFSIKSKDMKDGFNQIEDRNFGFGGGLQMAFVNRDDSTTTLTYFNGEHGQKFSLNLAKSFSVSERFILTPSLYGSYYLDKYSNYYFGVSEKEVLENMNIHSKYSPENSYSLGLSLTGEYFVTEHLGLIGFLGVDYFDSETSNSPIVEKNHSFYLGVGARYSF